MNQDQLNTLLSAWLDGRLTAEQSALLQQELRESAAARKEFHRWSALDAALREQAAQPVAAVVSSTKIVRKPWLPLAIAAAAAAVAFVFWPQPAEKAESLSTGVATLSQVMDAEFHGAQRRGGDTLSPGRIRLNRGLVQIEFFSSASAIIEGNTELEIISAWEARCHSGRVRVHVPPAAKGFLLHTPDLKLEDLGTEFALNVDGQTSAVKVFDGEVIAHTSNAPASLTTGMTLGSSPHSFLAVADLQSMVNARQLKRHQEWEAWSAKQRSDPRLIAYYTFKRWTNPQWDRLVNNFTEPRKKEHAGGAVGARWTQGRWPQKDALEFKRPGDRVRMNLNGSYEAITLACWVKVDSVDKKYNSLLLTDGYENGEPHWQIYEDGSLMFSIMYRPPTKPEKPNRRGAWNQLYFSRPLFTSDTLGRWHHIAITYDNKSGEVVQYFDGQEVSREISPLHKPGLLISFGPCEIGNWGLPTEGHEFPIRNLNGAIDEFVIYRSALPPKEVLSHYLEGKPE